MAEFYSGVNVCVAGGADKVPGREVPIRANGHLCGAFWDRRLRIRVRPDVAGSAVRYLVRTALDAPTNIDGLAGRELGRTQRTGARAEGKLIGISASGAICAYRVPAACIGYGYVSDRATVEACCDGGPGVLCVFKVPACAWPPCPAG